MRTSQQQFRAGTAIVGGQQCYFRSGLELRWAKYLEKLKEFGEIEDWLYEPKKFLFEKIKSGTRVYKPDFQVFMFKGHYWHEVKGHLTQKDKTKFHRMAIYYPDEIIFLAIQRITKKNALLVEKCERHVAGVIEAEKVLKANGM